MGTPAHWVEAAQGIWLTVHGHADRKETHTTINLYTSTQNTWESSHTQKSTKPILFLTKQTGSIKMDNPTSSQRQGDGGLGIILTTRTESLPRVLPSQQS